MSGDHSKHHLKSVSYVLVLTAAFMVVEIIFGFLTNSLALLADGVHMLTDVASLVITSVAFVVSRRPPTARKTFGFYRVEIFAAFLNSLFLSVLAVGIIFSAYGRLGAPPDVHVEQMFFVAIVGLLVNLISGLVLHKGAKENINLRGAFLHVVGDALASIGTLIAGALIWSKGWMLADPIMSLVIAVIILFSAFRLMNETIHLILQGVPVHLDPELIAQELKCLEGVTNVHHLHVWGLSSERVVLTVHLVIAPATDAHRVLTNAQSCLKSKFEIAHTTIQVEGQNLQSQEPHFP